MICKYCKQPMFCVKTWQDWKHDGNIKGLFTCDCKKFLKNTSEDQETIKKINGISVILKLRMTTERVLSIREL